MKIRILALTALLCIAASSCVKEKLEATYNKQESSIDKYIAQRVQTDSLRVVRNGGANRLVIEEGTGEPLGKKGSVSFYYAGYIFKGSVSATNMFMTNRETSATEAGWNLTDADYSLFETSLDAKDLIEGLKDGLTGVRTGETCEILFSGKYGFGNSTFGIIPANSALLYRIWVVGVSND
jgi:FKBP-type peptidyl-prolyl cis-trans isomerase